MNAGVHQYEDKLLDYAYGELPAHEAAAVDAHVRTCARCSQALDQIKGVRSVFAPLPMVAAPDAGLESLLAYADQHARRAKTEKQAPWRRWIFAFSSAAALLVVGVVAVRASKEAPQSAMDIVAGAEKEARKVESPQPPPVAAAPVAAAPVADIAPSEAKAEPQVWDERTGKRGLADPNSQEYADKTEALREKGAQQKQLRLDDALAKNDKARAEKPVDLETLAAGKKGGGDLAGAAARQSEGKRLAPAKEAEAQGGLVQDFSNANARGGRMQDRAKDVAVDAKKVAKNEEKLDSFDDQLNDGTSVKQSMTGTSSPPGYGVSAGSSVAYGQMADAPKGNLEQARSPASPPPPAQAVAPMAAPSQPAPATKSPQKAKVASGYGMMPRPSASEATADEDAPQAVSESSIGDASLRRERDQQLNIAAQLGQARAAANQGDRRGQVTAALRVLSAGAKGYSRAEALKSACDGFEALGEYDQAQQFCDLLLSEFRGTAAAQQVAQRRKAQLKPAAAPARKSIDMESEDKKAADMPAVAH